LKGEARATILIEMFYNLSSVLPGTFHDNKLHHHCFLPVFNPTSTDIPIRLAEKAQSIEL
jgi:hypothetical protein